MEISIPVANFEFKSQALNKERMSQLVDKNLSVAEAVEQCGKQKKKKKLDRGECSKNVEERIAKWKELNEKIESSLEGGRIKADRKGKGPAKVRESKKAGGKGGIENDFCSFKGVRQRAKSEKWMAEICVPNSGGKRLWLGSYDTAIEAALSYDAAVRAFYGSSAYERLNIPGYTESPSASTSTPSMEEEFEKKPSI